jgi:23S rRNA (guanosine2251-2'-O)-methyltransferase
MGACAYVNRPCRCQLKTPAGSSAASIFALRAESCRDKNYAHPPVFWIDDLTRDAPRQTATDKTWRPELRPARSGISGQKPAKAPMVRHEATVAVLYGFHAVREALRCKRRKLLGIYATEGAARRLEGEIAGAGLCPFIVTAEDLARRLGAGAAHQGVMLEALPLEPLDLSDIESRSGIVLVLDQITDPHNVGAILRTAAAFGVDAAVVTHRHAPEMAGVVAKTASGGLEHVAIVNVVNLARVLERLGNSGYLRLGFDSEAELSLATIPLRRPIALVLGGEGKGLRRLTRENCDLLVRLDMPGAIKSLNVSNACAVALTLLHAAPVA